MTIWHGGPLAGVSEVTPGAASGRMCRKTADILPGHGPCSTVPAMLRALSVLVVLALCTPAQAQIKDDRITSSVTPGTLTIAECSGKELSYTASVAVFPGETNTHSSWILEFGTTCGSPNPASEYTECAPGSESCCQRLSDGSMPQPSAAAGETLELSAKIQVNDVLDCGGDPKSSVSFFLKLYVLEAESNVITDDNEYIAKSDQVSLSLERPSTPSVPDVSAGETTIDVSWEDDDDFYRACAFLGTHDPLKPIGEQDVSGKTCSGKDDDGAVKISGLEKGRTYKVVLTRFDTDGNASLPSPVLSVSTQEVVDFYELYRREYGGGDPGGYCATTPGSRSGTGGGGGAAGFALLGFVGLGLALRRRRRALAAVVAATGLLVAAPAFAESPKFMTFEFRVGTWLPNVDSEFSGLKALGVAGPYERTFGDDGALVVDLEFASHVYQGIGTGSVGVGIGQGSVDAKGLNIDGTRSTEATSLAIYPLSLFAGYAFDWPAERWGFPLIPYGKLGLDWVLWSVSDGEGETASVSDSSTGVDGSGAGGTLGWHYAVGVRLLLDALSPEMARTFDLDMGVNNSYLFVEWLDATVDDFGEDNALHLGAEVVFWGLAFDF